MLRTRRLQDVTEQTEALAGLGSAGVLDGLRWASDAIYTPLETEFIAAARSAGREGEPATGTDQESGLAAPRHGTAPDPPARREVAKKGGGQTRPHTSPRQQRGARLSEGRSDPRPAAATAEGLGACAQAGEDGGRDAPQDEPARPPPGRGTGGGNPVPRGGTGFRPCGRSVGRTAAPRPPATVSGARLPIGSRAAYPYLILGQY